MPPIITLIMSSEILNNLTELLQNASDKQRQEIADMLSNINVNNRNNENIKQRKQ